MVSKDYKPSMKPKLEAANTKLGTPAQIRISKEYGRYLGTISDADDRLLKENLTGQAICPALYWFRDTPEVRRILKVDDPAPRGKEGA